MISEDLFSSNPRSSHRRSMRFTSNTHYVTRRSVSARKLRTHRFALLHIIDGVRLSASVRHSTSSTSNSTSWQPRWIGRSLFTSLHFCCTRDRDNTSRFFNDLDARDIFLQRFERIRLSKSRESYKSATLSSRSREKRRREENIPSRGHRLRFVNKRCLVTREFCASRGTMINAVYRVTAVIW